MVESTAPSYDVSFEMKKHFTPTEITGKLSSPDRSLDMQHAFKLYDSDKNGTMNATEFKQVLVDLGHRDVSDAQVQKMLKEVDKNGDSVIQWNEFLDVGSCITILLLDVQVPEGLKQGPLLLGVDHQGRVRTNLRHIFSEVVQ